MSTLDGFHDRPPSTPDAQHSIPPSAADGDLADAIRVRRANFSASERPMDDPETWGLALSGGGIRSATFCFGLIKALARNKVFRRFDLLSTVSGGGYIGATLGKLFHTAPNAGLSAAQVEEALGDADSRWFAFWLRANGRYLIPRGSKDLLFAAANFSRNLLGVHIELALMCVLLGSFLAGVDLGLWQWADSIYSGNADWQPAWLTLATLDVLSRWPSLWVLMPPLILAAGALASAYWVLPAVPGQAVPKRRWIMVVLYVIAACMMADYWSDQASSSEQVGAFRVPGWLMLCAGGALFAWILGTLVAFILTLRYSAVPDASRNRLTAGLAYTFKIGLGIIVLGLIDVMAWMLANAKPEHQGVFGTIAVLSVVALRAILPKIADLPRSLTPGTRLNLNGLIGMAGIAALVLLLVFWVSIVHRGVTLMLFDENRRVLQFSLSWTWLAVIALPAFVMVLVSFGNREFLNRSSLYAFYRARLVRSYLGAGNVARFGGKPHAASDVYSRSTAAQGPTVSVQDVHADDDVPMADYAPHEAGGPVHLINACVNQTSDPRGGIFNQDRKGLPITVGPRGQVRVGQERGWSQVAPSGSMTLGSWVAISGAAVAPGLGSSTKAGIAALLTMSGVRLGYWWNSLAIQHVEAQPKRPTVSKYAQLLAELRGRFAGTLSADWYLSDGGHFENTAAYALLREECSVVVIADCGADPRYAFGDLENLVRKARIDLQAEITFLKPKLAQDVAEGEVHIPAPEAFGSLNDLSSPESQACLALAQIAYRNGKRGHVIVVKPNMCAGVPVDLVNFKADHPLFPQEPTTDQFFSEAQWESYFNLGSTLGEHLQGKLLRNLARIADASFLVDDGSVVVRDEGGKLHPAPAPKRLPSRIAATGAVTASVSVGALLTLGATAWQAVDKQIQDIDKARRLDPVALKELTDLYGKLAPDTLKANPAASAAVPAASAAGRSEAGASTRLGEMATALLRIGDATCTVDNTEAFRQSALMQLMLNGTKRNCRESDPRHPSCDILLDDDLSVPCLHAVAQVRCIPRYWVRDYLETDAEKQNCLPTPHDEAVPEPSAQAGPAPTAPPATTPATSGTATATGGKPAAGASNSGAPPTTAPVTADPTTGAPVTASPAPATPSSGTPPAAVAVCAGKTIYIQIFGSEGRDKIRLLRQPWQGLGASVPPVEDVLDSARRRGRSAPEAPDQPIVIFHDESSQECAKRLEPAGSVVPWTVRALAPKLKGTPGTIEVWIPPTLTAAVDAAANASLVPRAFGATLPAMSYCYQEDTRQNGAERFGVHCHVKAAACEAARGPNPRRSQSTCSEVNTADQAKVLFGRGWGGSWYATQPQPFASPFPSLPATR